MADIYQLEGVTISILPYISADLKGATLRLTFQDATMELPVNPVDPSGDKKTVTITSGIMDITFGMEEESLFRKMMVVQMDTPEALVVISGDEQYVIEFDELKFGYNMAKFASLSGEPYYITGKVYVNGYEIDVAQIISMLSQ